MLIFIGPEYTELNLSPEQVQQRMGAWWAWQNKMEQDGVHKSGHALHPEFKRVSGPDRTVTDQATTEVKELIGGYYIVKAEDYAGAIKIAEDYPDYDLGGTVEVREVLVFTQ